MAGANRKSGVVDENIEEGGTCTHLRRSLEPESVKDIPRTALVVNDSPRRCIVFKVFTLEIDACQKLQLPVSLPLQEPDRGVCVGPEVHGKLESLNQASSMPSVLFKVDLQKDQRIHVPTHQGSANAYVISSSPREHVAGPSRKKSKHCKSVKNFSATCLQNSVTLNIFLVCDGSNIVISNALANSNLTVGKLMKRNSKKKTKRKGRQHKRFLHWKGSVGAGITHAESVCSVPLCESSILNDPSSPEEMSEDVFSRTATSYRLPVKVSVEKNGSDQCSVDALDPSMVTVKCSSCANETDESEQMAALSSDFAQVNFSDNLTGINGCSNNINDHSSAEPTLETAISTSSRSVYISNLNDILSYPLFSQNNALIPDRILDVGNCDTDSTAFSGADMEMQSFTNKGSICSYAEGEMVRNHQQDMKSQCVTSDSCKTHINKPNNFDLYACCSSDDSIPTGNIADRTRCSSEACSSSSSNVFQPIKRGRNSRKTSGGLNGLHRSGNAGTRARTGKDVHQFVWQRVKRNTDEESINEFKDPDSGPLQHDIACQVTEGRLDDDASFSVGQTWDRDYCRYPCIVEATGDSASTRMMANTGATKHLSQSSGKLVTKIHDKLKVNSMLVPKQGHNHLSRKGSENDKNDSARLLKDNKIYAVCPRSIPETDSQRSDVSPDKANTFPLPLWAKEKIHAIEMTPTENRSDMVQNIGSLAARGDVNLLKTTDSLDMKCTLEENCDVTDAKLDGHIHHGFCNIPEKKSSGYSLENGGLFTEHNRHDNNFLPMLQKWVPVGKRDEGTSKLKRVSGSVGCISPELDGVIDKSPKGPCNMSKGHVPSNFRFTQEAGDKSTFNFETDLDKIICVVKEAYQLQIASETFQLATGSPLTEFERFLCSASPVLGQISSIPSCKSCSQDHQVGHTLCQHQMPKISLQNLWQWYEKPGNYGLEVKVEDYLNPKRVGNDKFDFRAYFVPYLSAVQLFGWSAGCTCSNSFISNGKINIEHQADSISKDSSLPSNLPIFSLLVPRPRKEAVQTLDPPSLSSTKDDPCNCLVKTCLMAQGLLFEYFESDQPQLRQPFLEKIKELVEGNSFSNSQTFGDPLKLECLNLHDLHPASWFAVAWYPIYRIPDGNFRAAFLTYHSLGHFTHRGASLRSGDGVSHIICPVVGIQSYNAKGECWFQQRGSQAVQIGESSTPTPSEILRERLRTLERTASVMSRALVPKGDQVSVNRQPDYEFFISRGP